jgi:hypothetical protein
VALLAGCCLCLVATAIAQADTVAFSSTGSEQAFTVPAGVTSIHVVAIGAPGGAAGNDAGGRGAQATADLAVTPGEALYVEVGAKGGDGDPQGFGPGGAGGFNGGGGGGPGVSGTNPSGGGGGGASDVRTVPSGQPGSLAARLIVAGAGGGGPGGGAAGAAGTEGAHPGQPGTASAGGTPNGGLGTGGAATSVSGGGGGGGLYGGGAGGSTSGGGGGSSGVGAGAFNTSVIADTTGTPSITFTFTQTFVLTVAKAGSGTGTVTSTDGQLSCGSLCARAYAAGTSVTLSASADPGSSFAGWSGGGCSGTALCTVRMSSDQSVTATFASLPVSVAPPNTRITQARIGSNKRNAVFKFKASGKNTGFQCALVSKKHPKPRFKSCRSPKTYKHLKNGRYTFDVRAIGPGGKDPSPAKKRFKISG